MTIWLRFPLAVLACWRISHLLAAEDGPFDIVVRLRRRLGPLMDCFYCLSVWTAAPLAFFVTRDWAEAVVSWLAISGAACLLERTGQQPVVIQPLEGENPDVLWRETSSSGPGGHDPAGPTGIHVTRR